MEQPEASAEAVVRFASDLLKAQRHYCLELEKAARTYQSKIEKWSTQDAALLRNSSRPRDSLEGALEIVVRTLLDSARLQKDNAKLLHSLGTRLAHHFDGAEQQRKKTVGEGERYLARLHDLKGAEIKAMAQVSKQEVDIMSLEDELTKSDSRAREKVRVKLGGARERLVRYFAEREKAELALIDADKRIVDFGIRDALDSLQRLEEYRMDKTVAYLKYFVHAEKEFFPADSTMWSEASKTLSSCRPDGDLLEFAESVRAAYGLQPLANSEAYSRGRAGAIDAERSTELEDLTRRVRLSQAAEETVGVFGSRTENKRSTGTDEGLFGESESVDHPEEAGERRRREKNKELFGDDENADVDAFDSKHNNDLLPLAQRPFQHIEIFVQDFRVVLLAADMQSSESNVKDKTPREAKAAPTAIIIDRRYGTHEGVDGSSLRDLATVPNMRAYGIAGVLQMATGPYLLIIIDATVVAKIQDHVIYEIKKVEALPMVLKTNRRTVSDKIRKEEKAMVAAVENELTTGVYFSYTLNLTRNLQRRMRHPPVQGIWEVADIRFMWNGHVARDFIEKPYSGWILPLVCGFFAARDAFVNNKSVRLSLLSRRSARRAGVRYHARGMDDKGNVANYVETEMLVEADIFGSPPVFFEQKPDPKQQHFVALVRQFEKVSIVNLVEEKGSEAIVGQMFENLYKNMMPTEDVVAVSERDPTAALPPLIRGAAQSQDVKTHPSMRMYKPGLLSRGVLAIEQDDIRFFWFDFHHHCKKMKFDRISLLLDRARDDIAEMQFFSNICIHTGATTLEKGDAAECDNRSQQPGNNDPPSLPLPATPNQTVPERVPLRRTLGETLLPESTAAPVESRRRFDKDMFVAKFDEQSGIRAHLCRQKRVFRVNCVDCLDRSNVVQSQLAHNVLLRVLLSMGIISKDEREMMAWPQSKGIYSVPELDIVFKELWADNGDALSRQYSGTAALKRDFTRTGKRTIKGLIDDGVNSLTRYYRNTFRDVIRQAALDVMHGVINFANPESSQTLYRNWQDAQIHAIRLCCDRLLTSQEEFVQGWSLLSESKGTLQEVVVILTKDNLYHVEYDSEEGEVQSYAKMPLIEITMIEVKLCSLKGSHPFSEEDAIRESSDAESTHGYDSEDEADEEEMAPRPSSAKEKKRGGHKLIWGCVLGTAIKVKPAKGKIKVFSRIPHADATAATTREQVYLPHLAMMETMRSYRNVAVDFGKSVLSCINQLVGRGFFAKPQVSFPPEKSSRPVSVRAAMQLPSAPVPIRVLEDVTPEASPSGMTE